MTRSSRRPWTSGGGEDLAVESLVPHVPQDSGGDRDIYVYSRWSGHFELISVSTRGHKGNGPSFRPVIAGLWIVAYESDATNLVDNDTNRSRDVFSQFLTSCTGPVLIPSDRGGDGPATTVIGMVLPFAGNYDPMLAGATCEHVTRRGL